MLCELVDFESCGFSGFTGFAEFQGDSRPNVLSFDSGFWVWLPEYFGFRVLG